MSMGDLPSEKIVINYEDLPDPPLPPPSVAGLDTPFAFEQAGSHASPSRIAPAVIIIAALSLVAIVILVLVILSTSSNNTRAEATQRYWDQFCRIDSQTASLGPKVSANTAQEVREAMNARADTCRTAIQSITHLEVRDVDPDLIDLGGQKMAVLGQFAPKFDGLSEQLTRLEALKERADSTGVLVESFIRGLFGDPFGTSDELKGEGKALDASIRVLLDELRKLEVENNDISVRMTRLRAELMNRYSRDFTAPRKDPNP